jgi:hypothetical protein
MMLLIGQPESFWIQPISQYERALPPAKNQLGAAFSPPAGACMRGCSVYNITKRVLLLGD